MRAAVVTLVIGIAIGVAIGRWTAALIAIEHRPEMQAPATSAAVKVEAPRAIAVTASADAILTSAIDAIPAPPVERGAGRISGHVRTRAGAPLAGVQVAAVPSAPDDDEPKTSMASGPRDIEAEVRALVSRLRSRDLAAARGVTDARGAFELTGVADGRCEVQAHCDGYAIASVPGEPGAVVELTATPVLRLPVEVLLPDGRPPERATVHLENGSTGKAHDWRPGAPTIPIDPGVWRLSASAGVDDALRSPSQRVRILEGAPPPAVTLRLASRPGMVVTVKIPADEAPVQRGVVVRAHAYTGGPLSEKDSPDHEFRSFGWPGEPIAVLVGTPGPYVVRVSRRVGLDAPVTRIVEIADSITPIEVTLEPIDPQLGIAAHVLGPDGEPASGASFDLRARSTDSIEGVEVFWVRMRDGSWRVSPTRVEPGKPARPISSLEDATLKVTVPWLGSHTLAIARGQSDVTVRFDAPAWLDASVAGLSGSTLEGHLKVRLGHAGASESESTLNDLDDDGHAIIEGLAPGAYTIGTEVEQGSVSLPASSGPIAIVAGRNEVALPLPHVDGLLVTAPEGTLIALSLCPETSNTGDLDVEKVTRERGAAQFSNLLPGRYTLSTSGGTGYMDVTVPAGGPVAFAPRPTPAMFVRSVDAVEGGARSELRVGDYIVEVGGEPFATAEEYRAKVAVLEGASVPVTIRRNGARLAITATARALQGEEGPNLTPAHMPE